MDASGFLRERRERQLRAGRRKLIIMVFLLVGLVVVMFELGRQGGTFFSRKAEERSHEDEPDLSQQKAVSAPKGELPDFGSYGKPSQELALSQEEIEKKYPTLADPRVLELILDQDTVVEPAGFFYLLYQVFRESQDHLRSEAQTDYDWETFWRKAPSVRTRAFLVKGRVVKIWRQPLGKNPMGLREVWAYRIRELEVPPDHPEGHLYDVYAIKKLKGALPWDDVKVYARFLKAQTLEPKEPRDPELHTAVFIAREFEPLTYIDEPEMPGPVVEGNRPEARAFYWLVKRAMETPLETLRAEGKRNLTYLDFLNRPERYRAGPVVIYGELRRMIRVKLPENILDLPDIFYGQIADSDRKVNTFYSLEVPEGVHLKDPVRIYGYFMKNWTYLARGGHEVTSPVFVAKALRVVPYPVAESHTIEGIFLAVVGVTGIVVFVIVLRERARDRALAEQRRQRRLERVRDTLSQLSRHEKEQEQ